MSALQLVTAADVEYRQARNKRLLVEVMLMKVSYLSSAIESAQSGHVQVVEKKKPENNKDLTSVPSPEQVAAPEKKESEQKEDSKIKKTETQDDTPPVHEEVKPAKKNLKLSIGNLSSLEKLDDEVAKDVKETFRDVSEISIEEVKEFWNKYLEKENSDIIKQSLKAAKLALYDNFLNITVGSKLQQEDVLKEKDLMVYLRESLKVKNLKPNVIVEKIETNEKPVIKKNLTVKERYLQMRELNPALTSLQKRFTLMPDE